MKFVADESVDRQIIERLRKDGHNVIAIAEEKPSISDSEVLSMAQSNQALLITCDKDFGELVFRLNQVHGGVILLRLAGISSDDKATITAEFLQEHSDEVTGAFTVISTNNVRIRSTDV
jgi:predicted nuclease of predicted toxin-antitoxin system